MNVAEQVDVFHKSVTGHNTGEEEVAWLAIDARFPHVTLPYTLDHRVDEETFLAIEAALRDLQYGAEVAVRDDRMRKLKRLFTELNVSISHHANREDAHIIPLLQENFTLPEQGDIAGRMIAHISRDVMPWMVPAIARAITLEEQVDYVDMMMHAMPPEAFHAVAGWIKAGIPGPQWSELSFRVPELGAATG
jgi:hypothetical protein